MELAFEREERLLHAARVGDDALISQLLDDDTDPNELTDTGEFKRIKGTLTPIHVTPLHASVFKNHAAATRLLLDRGADPSIADSLNVTPLMKAAYMGLQEQLRMLLDAGAELEAVEPITGHTAFLWACHDGKTDCAEMLVRAGCNSSHRNKSGLTGRDIAQQRGHTAVVERLRAVVVEQLATRASSHGIAIEDEPEPALDIEPDAAGATLHSAAGAGDTATISQLLDEGCEINVLKDGWTALQMAVMLNQLPAAQLLLNRGADPSIPNSLGITPIIMASGNEESLPLLRLLIEAGAELDTAQPQTGRTGFHEACIKGNAGCAEALARAGCNVSLRDLDGKTGRECAEELAAEPAPTPFQVGDRVERRDGAVPWGEGFVTQLEPLEVTASSTNPNGQGFVWEEVRPLIDERESEAAEVAAAERERYTAVLERLAALKRTEANRKKKEKKRRKKEREKQEAMKAAAAAGDVADPVAELDDEPEPAPEPAFEAMLAAMKAEDALAAPAAEVSPTFAHGSSPRC